jgi:hypothetical protein
MCALPILFAILFLPIILALLLAAGGRKAGSGGVVHAERTPVNPPAPVRLIALLPRDEGDQP